MEQKSLTLRECLIGDRTFYRHVAVVVLPIIVQNTLPTWSACWIM